MRIAKGYKHDGGALRFDVRIPFLAPCEVLLTKVANPGERQPHWHVTHQGERCGALWRREPRNGGEAFLSGQIESPVFPGGKLEIAVFNSKEPGHLKDMTWRPADERRETTSPASDSGYASQSAPADRGEEDDDDIPF
jgi:uncharacterized protein (DUF736 family)